MSISIRCPDCDKKLRARDELAGKQVKCPRCGSLLVIPAAHPSSDSLMVPEAERARWPWYVGGGVGACLVVVAVVIFVIPGGDNPDKGQVVAKDAKSIPAKNDKPEKNDEAKSDHQPVKSSLDDASNRPPETNAKLPPPTTAPDPKLTKRPIVVSELSLGTFGEWEIQLLRFEFARFTTSREAGGGLMAHDYDLVGSTPSEHLVVYLKSICQKDVSYKGFAGLPSFHIAGDSNPLTLNALGWGDMGRGERRIVGMPAITRGIIGSGGKADWKKGEHKSVVAVVVLPSNSIAAIADKGIKMQVRGLHEGVANVDLPLLIPGKWQGKEETAVEQKASGDLSKVIVGRWVQSPSVSDFDGKDLTTNIEFAADGTFIIHFGTFDEAQRRDLLSVLKEQDSRYKVIDNNRIDWVMKAATITFTVLSSSQNELALEASEKFFAGGKLKSISLKRR
jgi:DNA-directed RNA polymerase subunit RPC12/RpoP